MMGLSDGRKSFQIGLAVFIQYRSVTASHPASQPASHVAVAITLNAKASSLKTYYLIRATLHDVTSFGGHKGQTFECGGAAAPTHSPLKPPLMVTKL